MTYNEAFSLWVAEDSQNKCTHTSRAKRVQQTSMQVVLDTERDVLLQAARRNASQYSKAEDATKDFFIW